MKRRTAIVVAVVLLLGAVVAIQLADPQFVDRNPPEVDFSEPPAEVAADAATKFEYIDYAYRIRLKNQQKSSWDTLLSVHVDHTNRRYTSTGPLGENGTVIFGNDALTFAKPGGKAEWKLRSSPETTYPAEGFTQPFSVEEINSSNTTVVNRNSTLVVLLIDCVILKVGSSYPGESIIEIDRESGLIVEATSIYQPSSTQQRYIRFELEERNSGVNRPSDISPSIGEIFWDLFRGPLFG